MLTRSSLSGYTADAVRRRRDAVSLIQTIHGHDNPKSVQALYDLGLACYDNGGASEALEHLLAANEVLRSIDNPDPVLRSSVLLALGNAYLALVCPLQPPGNALIV